jgi:hypothetical protein
VKRELKKPQKKKSKSTSPTGFITSPLSVNKDSSQQQADPLSLVGNETTATATSSTSTTATNSNSTSAQTARQLAERARVMKDREELSQIRREKEEMGKKLEKAEKERDDVKKEVVGSKKEVGFKDEVSHTLGRWTRWQVCRTAEVDSIEIERNRLSNRKTGSWTISRKR